MIGLSKATLSPSEIQCNVPPIMYYIPTQPISAISVPIEPLALTEAATENGQLVFYWIGLMKNCYCIDSQCQGGAKAKGVLATVYLKNLIVIQFVYLEPIYTHSNLQLSTYSSKTQHVIGYLPSLADSKLPGIKISVGFCMYGRKVHILPPCRDSLSHCFCH